MRDSEEARLQAGLNLVTGAPDPGAEKLRRSGMRRTMIVVWSSMVGVVIIGVTVVVGVRGRNRAKPALIPEWRSLTGNALAITSLILIAVMLVIAARNRTWSSWKSPLFSLTWAQRRNILRQVTGKLAVNPSQLPLSREMARSVIRNRNANYFMLPILLNVIGSAIRANETWNWISVAVLGTLLIFGVASAVSNVRKARRFLRTYPDLQAFPV